MLKLGRRSCHLRVQGACATEAAGSLTCSLHLKPLDNDLHRVPPAELVWQALRSKSEEAVSSGEATEAAGIGGQRKSNTELAKELLGKYGAAYLATSISLALVSFTFFYVLVDRGVDVSSLLRQVSPHSLVVPSLGRWMVVRQRVALRKLGFENTFGKCRAVCAFHSPLGAHYAHGACGAPVLLVLVPQFGVDVDSTGQKVGTVALAYAAHKASSPIRFPPTVLLTPSWPISLGRPRRKQARASN